MKETITRLFTISVYYIKPDTIHHNFSDVLYDFPDIPKILPWALKMKDKYKDFSMHISVDSNEPKDLEEASVIATKYLEQFCKEQGLSLTRNDYYTSINYTHSVFTISKISYELDQESEPVKTGLDEAIEALDFFLKLVRGIEND